MSNGRAPKGGTTGINGEHYEGGKFLPSTTSPKRQGKARKATGRVQIEPFLWADRPEIPGFTARPIFGSVSEAIDWNAARRNPGAPLQIYEPGLAVHGPDARALAEAYIRGERWILAPDAT